MTLQEIMDTMESVGKLNLAEMEVKDQAAYIIVASKFAGTLKPLVIKYIDKVPSGNTFLFKL